MKLINNEVIQVQQALTKLQEVKLPVKASIDIALLMNTIEGQVKAFGIVRDKLFKDYSITTEKGDTEGTVRFVCTDKSKEKENLETFTGEFNKLLETETSEFAFSSKIKLPKDLEVEPSILRPLTDFVEVE